MALFWVIHVLLEAGLRVNNLINLHAGLFQAGHRRTAVSRHLRTALRMLRAQASVRRN